MRKMLATLALGLIFTQAASAGDIVGRILVNGKEADPGTRVQVKYKSDTFGSTVGQHGIYSVRFPHNGPCQIAITIGSACACADILAFDGPTSCNVELRKRGGKIEIVRISS